MILLDTPGDAAVEVAERIRQGVAALDLGEPTEASPQHRHRRVPG